MIIIIAKFMYNPKEMTNFWNVNIKLTYWIGFLQNKLKADAVINLRPTNTLEVWLGFNVFKNLQHNLEYTKHILWQLHCSSKSLSSSANIYHKYQTHLLLKSAAIMEEDLNILQKVMNIKVGFGMNEWLSTKKGDSGSALETGSNVAFPNSLYPRACCLEVSEHLS